MTVMVAAMSSIFLRVALIARASTCVNTNAMQPRAKVTRSQRPEFSDFTTPYIYAHSYTSSAPGNFSDHTSSIDDPLSIKSIRKNYLKKQ